MLIDLKCFVMFVAFKVENNSIKKNHWVLRSTERDSIEHAVK